MLNNSFETTKNKLEKIWNETEKNQNNIDKNIKIIDKNYRSEQFNKKIHKIELLNDFLISSPTITQPTTNNFSFNNLNEDIVTNSQLSIVLKSNNPDFDFDKLLFSQPANNILTLDAFWITEKSVKHWWEKSEELWTIFIQANVVFEQATQLPPLQILRKKLDVYIDINLYFINERNLNAVQSKQ